MNKAEEYFKEWSSICRLYITKDNPTIHSHTTLLQFAEDFHKPQTLKEHSDKLTLLKNYSEFLEKNGYLDTDWRYEKPYAINEYLKTTK